ncbi:putative toxin-antitoxin system toxin component, PIN family [Euzebya tangerina]|uniref:putative toxin-antitoxin system toxin component, PIN family n=1 Tax=Euzebya tangerina TaxID=591198 RepID=UPI000E31970B|nr:putative toxin-antitoxin system toxin component, PIN family [Euzebya tangerina]
MRAVIDTNVWVSGLIQPSSKAGKVVRAVRDRRLEPVCTWHLVREIVDVLRRPKIAEYGVTETDVAAVLELLRPYVPSVDADAWVSGVDVPLRDEQDLHVVSAALIGNASVIVTGDHDFLEDDRVREWLRSREIGVLSIPEVLEHLET